MSDKALYKFVEGLWAMSEKDGLPPWERCTVDGIVGTGPVNAKTGKAYRGSNWLWLLMNGVDYAAGAKQWKSLGVTSIDRSQVLWILAPSRWITREDVSGTKHRFPIGWRGVKVYPHSAVKGWTPPAKPDVVPVDPIDAAEALIAAMPNAPAVSFSDHATTGSYAPTLDAVTMPLRDHCRSAEHYYKTYLHELAHSTGHASRCKRDLSGFSGSHEYSREELVAEFTAAFLAMRCGIHDATRENSAAYIKSWRRFIAKDPKVFLSAVADAQKAADYIAPEASAEKSADTEAA
jgi:antirestriction protein ArdC